ncbi:MAG: ABC transporter permease [Chloroflexota bacterium]
MLRRALLSTIGLTVATFLACLVGAAILLATHQNPLDAAKGLWDGAFGSNVQTYATLSQTTPLIFAALSFMFAFRAGIFNAGGQGQFIMGAFASSWAGFTPGLAHLPAAIHVPLVVIAGFTGGSLWALPPILLKIYAGTNEILTTLMMSYIADLLNDYLVLDVFRASTIQPGTNAQTPTLVPSATFPTLFPQSQVTFLLPLGVIAAVLIWAFFQRTVLGYELNLFGTGPMVARSGGVGTTKLMLTSMLVSGGLAGVAGASVVAGVFQADITPFSSNVGFNGILAALLARNLALFIPFTALFFGALEQGGLGLQIYTPISQYISDVLIATIIIFASARSLPRIAWRRIFPHAAHEPSR